MDPNAARPSRAAVAGYDRIGQVAANNDFVRAVQNLHANVRDGIDRGELQTPSVSDKSGIAERIIHDIERPGAVRISATKHRELVRVRPRWRWGREQIILLAVVGR